MSVLGWDVPMWVLDWSGSLMVVVSLWYLFGKRIAYWYWSNASLLPYFALFATTGQLMLAGLQASYLSGSLDQRAAQVRSILEGRPVGSSRHVDSLGPRPSEVQR